MGNFSAGRIGSAGKLALTYFRGRAYMAFNVINSSQAPIDPSGAIKLGVFPCGRIRQAAVTWNQLSVSLVPVMSRKLGNWLRSFGVEPNSRTVYEAASDPACRPQFKKPDGQPTQTVRLPI